MKIESSRQTWTVRMHERTNEDCDFLSSWRSLSTSPKPLSKQSEEKGTINVMFQYKIFNNKRLLFKTPLLFQDFIFHNHASMRWFCWIFWVVKDWVKSSTRQSDKLNLNQNHHLDSGLLTCTLPPSFTSLLSALAKNFKG